MRKFKRNYFAVLMFTVILLITVSGKIGAITGLITGYYPVAPGNTVSGNGLPLQDTVPAKKDSSIVKDSLGMKGEPSLKADSLLTTDTLPGSGKDTFTVKISKDTLDAPVKYHAEDSVVGHVDQKTVELYGKASTEYQRNTLTAPYLKLNQETGVVSARAGRDSLGEIDEYVTMKDGESEYHSDSMNYNFKTQKGIIRGTITQQGELFLHSEIAKKVDENTVYALGNFFTTCNLDHPHFGFRARRAKVVNKKLAVTGAVRPEFDSVPVPIYLPFGFYPLYQGRHSGVMSPSFEFNDQRGLGLSGMGFYQVINDYWDVKIYGDIYSYGSWRANVNPTYRKIYKYSGSLNFGLQNTRNNFKGDPDFYSSKTYNLDWSHSSDTRSRPGVNFSANVHTSSTKYNRDVPNSNSLNFQNVLGSSITYSKQWIDKPFNFTLSANHNQNNGQHAMTINLPNAGFTVSTLYPLQKKEAVGAKKWYEQLGIGYTGNFRNDISFYDTLNYKRDRGQSFSSFLLDTLQWSANHSIPVSLSLPPVLGGALIIAPSISYSQEWVDRETTRRWGSRGDKDTILADVNKGFFIKQQTSFGLSFNTTLYGNYVFKGDKVKAIRHVLRPQFGLNYTPDMTRNFWQRVQIDSIGTTALFNKLDGLFATPRNQFTSQRSGGISFGLDNNLEMKVKAKPKKKQSENEEERINDDSGGGVFSLEGKDSYADTNDEDAEKGIKKIKLIDRFGFNGAYNFLADSFRLSPINFYFGTNLFDRININASANLVPYKLNDYGYATPEYAWAGRKFSPGTITNANISLSTSFQSKPTDPEKQKQREEAINKNLNDPMLQADQQRLLEYIRQNPAEFVDFNTPWSVNLSYSLTYSRQGRNLQTLQSSVSPVTSSVNWSGSFNLTPKWNFSLNGSYDFTTTQMQYMSMAISRDLHCWQMSINVNPIGIYKSFSFTISPKAGVLQDLKINRNRSFFSGR